MTQLPSSESENQSRLMERLTSMLPLGQGRCTFLVDGDRTLTPEDTSRQFLELAGVDWHPIKQFFQKEGYTFEAFRFHSEVHLGIPRNLFEATAQKVAAQTTLHAGAAEFLREASIRASLFIVSSGVPAIWRNILHREKVEHALVIGGIEHDAPLVYGRKEKGQTCEWFRQVAARVVAVGDSDVDADMMRFAHQAVVVMNHRRNEDLLPHLAGHRALWQIVPQGEPHREICITSFPELISTLKLE